MAGEVWDKRTDPRKPIAYVVATDRFLSGWGQTLEDNMSDARTKIPSELLTTIAIRAHQTGYFRVELTDTGEIETHEDIDFNDRRPANHLLLTVGTGSVPCNCDACRAGHDPAEWAYDDGDALLHYVERLEDALAEIHAAAER